MFRIGTFSLVVLFSINAADARIKKIWSFKDLHEHSDVVVIATAIETKDSNYDDINRPNYMVQVETIIEVHATFKGSISPAISITLAHYRLAEGTVVINGPDLVDLPAQNGAYLLFLNLRSDGKYEAVSGQIDPVDSVKVLTHPSVSHKTMEQQSEAAKVHDDLTAQSTTDASRNPVSDYPSNQSKWRVIKEPTSLVAGGPARIGWVVRDVNFITDVFAQFGASHSVIPACAFTGLCWLMGD